MKNLNKCKIKNCNNKVICKNVCWKHYYQLYKYGKILERTRFDKNEIIDCENYCEICLYNYKHKEIARTKIDKKNINKVKKYKWYLVSNGYVSNKNKKISLHQLIIGGKTELIDHKNHDTLDNREQNLRHCTRSQNGMNRKVKGYYWDKNLNKWRVKLMIKNKIINLGCFKNELNAIEARRLAEQKYYKDFAYQY